ncbi:MAG TPA: hypothetical protein VHY22_13470 [Chthoniobacteraceae bacterium]|jgi:hypothetical protein|nr:hypothetical protein [Chthoniobacteraceae bacterium]
MNVESLRKLAVRSMQTPGMTRASIAEINGALSELDQLEAGRRTANAEIGDPREAAAAFERDMAPICEAVAGAIRAGDLAAFAGLKGMFARLLAEANAEPALAGVLQRQIGAALLDGLTGTKGGTA